MAVWSSKSGKGKILIFLIAGVLLMVALGGVAVVKFKGGHKKHAKAEAEVAAPVTGPKTEVDMGEMVVNLADTSESRYLKVNIVLEVEGTMPASGEGEKAGASPKMRDAVIETLSARTYEELLSPKGKSDLKESIKTIVNKTLKESNKATGQEAKVTDVFFNDFAMQ